MIEPKYLAASINSGRRSPFGTSDNQDPTAYLVVLETVAIEDADALRVGSIIIDLMLLKHPTTPEKKITPNGTITCLPEPTITLDCPVASRSRCV